MDLSWGNQIGMMKIEISNLLLALQFLGPELLWLDNFAQVHRAN